LVFWTGVAKELKNQKPHTSAKDALGWATDHFLPGKLRTVARDGYSPRKFRTSALSP